VSLARPDQAHFGQVTPIDMRMFSPRKDPPPAECTERGADEPNGVDGLAVVSWTWLRSIL